MRSHFAFAGGDELVEHDLRAIGEIAELRFPERQRVGFGQRIAVFEAQHGIFREHRVDDLVMRLTRADVVERVVAFFGVLVDQAGMALAEGAAGAVLPGTGAPGSLRSGASRRPAPRPWPSRSPRRSRTSRAWFPAAAPRSCAAGSLRARWSGPCPPRPWSSWRWRSCRAGISSPSSCRDATTCRPASRPCSGGIPCRPRTRRSCGPGRRPSCPRSRPRGSARP